MRRALALLAAGVAACDSAPQTIAPGCSGGAHDDAIVAVSDYASSGVGGFGLDDTGYLSFGVELGKDPELSTTAGRAFLVARDSGKLYELDPRCGTPTGAVFVTNNPGDSRSFDPQDVAVAPDGTLWVPRYLLAPSVAILAADGGFERALDLTSYDPDGNPNPSAVAIAEVGGAAKAFVALEMLDDTQSPFPKPYPNLAARILRIDVATRRIEATLDLAGRNPFGLFFAYGGALWLAEPGDVDTANEPLAGVERFDPQTSTSRLVVSESALAGASVTEVAVTAGCGAAIVADPSPQNRTALVTFDPITGAALTTWANPVFGPTVGFDLQAMLWIGSVLVVGDRSTTADGRFAAHAFDLSPPCTLRERVPVAIRLPQRPIAFRAALH